MNALLPLNWTIHIWCEKTLVSTVTCGNPATLNAFNRQIFQSWKNKAYAMFENTGIFEEVTLAVTEEKEAEK